MATNVSLSLSTDSSLEYKNTAVLFCNKTTVQDHYISITKNPKKIVVKIVVFGNKTRVQNQPASSKSILESEDTLNAQLYNVHGILHNCTQYFAQLFIVYYTIVHSILHNRTLDFASQKHTTTRKHSTSIFCGQMNTSDQHYTVP